MLAQPHKQWIEECYRAQIPAAAVFLRCCNWGLLPQRATQLAEEAAAESYRRSLRQQFNDATHFRNWVTVVASNYATDRLRKDGRTVSLDNECAYSRSGPSELLQELAEGLEQLSPQERLAINLTYQHDQTLDEIAAEMYPNDSRTVNAKRLRVKRVRDRAIAKLRLFLSETRKTGLIGAPCCTKG
jgi:RNA polymerase sigma factor (sigma-70 family)